MNSQELSRHDFFAEWSRLHGGAEIKGIVRAWLSISFAITIALKAIRVTPNGLTYLSLIFGALFLYFVDSHWAIAFLVLSLMADGLDGSLAIITSRVTRWGAALDAVIDRIVESLWALGLFMLGADWKWVLLAWLAAFSQEYMRARAAGLGVQEVGVVTISERPIRASLIFIVLIGRIFDFALANSVAIIWVAMQIISVVTVLRFLRPLLQQSQR